MLDNAGYDKLKMSAGATEHRPASPRSWAHLPDRVPPAYAFWGKQDGQDRDFGSRLRADVQF